MSYCAIFFVVLISMINAQYEENLKNVDDIQDAQHEQTKARAIVAYYSSRIEAVSYFSRCTRISF